MPKDTPRVYAIQTNVTDTHEAITFYEILGFKLLTPDYLPAVAPMQSGNTMLVLHKVKDKRITRIEEAHLAMNMLTSNIDSLIDQLGGSGQIEVLHNSKQSSAIGNWVSIRDPFGNIINLVEPDGIPYNSSGTEFFNVSVVIDDLNKASQFYNQILGFDIYSENYLPHALPLVTDGTISSITLHDSNAQPVQFEYPNSTVSFLVLEVADLDDAMSELKSEGVQFIQDVPLEAAIGRYVVFKDPFGLVYEMVELNESSKNGI
ncbi:VOC family protein [Bacteroidota bacterium]